MTEKELKGAVGVASKYYKPGEGGSSKKEPLRRRVAMAVLGKHYKTKAARRANRQTAKNKRVLGSMTGRTRAIIRQADQYGAPEVRKIANRRRKK